MAYEKVIALLTDNPELAFKVLPPYFRRLPIERAKSEAYLMAIHCPPRIKGPLATINEAFKTDAFCAAWTKLCAA